MAALALAGPGTPAASALQPPPPDVPLPDSSFQGADGDQEEAGDRIDWETLERDDRVRPSPDGTAGDSAFTQGSEVTQPRGWVLTTENVPPKDNVLDAWSAVDQPAEDTALPEEDTFLYLAFTREGGGGTTSLTFELNHDARLWTNDKGARIPCRRDGDVLISFVQHGHDTPEIQIRRWNEGITDTESGCDATGSLGPAADVELGVDAQGAANSGPITNHLPVTATPAGTIPARQFAETSLNLTELLGQTLRDECFAFGSIWMHSRASEGVTSAMKDYVAPRELSVRTCSASGTKFFDSDADGERDPGEPGIPRFLIWADYDADGIRDPNEPFSVSDANGRYVVNDIRPPGGTYMLRERLLPRTRATIPIATEWFCSFPNASTAGGTATAPGGRFGCGWGPIDPTMTPHAEGLDFGNWFPAQITLRKEFEPAGDAGRADLLVNDVVVLPGAGDGESVTVSVPPGTYTVSERPTTPGDFRSTVECRRGPPQVGGIEPGAVFTGLVLPAGRRATCTFRNIRPGAPAIAIRKTGPEIATAGDTLRYTLLVSNPGDVAFAAADVEVSDPACDDPPELVSKQDDPSPGTLDPGDTWTYRCSNETTSGGGDCEPTRVDNTSTVVAGSVRDADSISTILLCPDVPVVPSPRPPDPPGPAGPRDPDEPGPVAPAGSSPPTAGEAGVARALFRQATRRCIRSRVPRVRFTGTRIARVRVFVGGRLRRNLTVRTLQRRVRPRVTLAPGRYRVVVRVTFQHGSGTPPVTLARTVRICGPAAVAPRFTG